MKDKENVNVSTKEEIEARNKKGKEKTELKQALLHYATAEASGGIKSLIDCEGCAFYLYEMLGYRNCKDKVVLSREEYENSFDIKVYNKVREENRLLKEQADRLLEELVKERKETATTILQEFANIKVNGSSIQDYMVAVKVVNKIDELSKRYGVKIKE